LDGSYSGRESGKYDKPWDIDSPFDLRGPPPRKFFFSWTRLLILDLEQINRIQFFSHTYQFTLEDPTS
jgi:hypothetical protein